MNINWYPGHMKKTMDNIRASLKFVDIVGEIIDARIPISSKNPVIDDVLKDKPRIMILNKSDMANENETRKWLIIEVKAMVQLLLTHFILRD